MAEFGNPALPPRFWAKVRVAESGCWEWTASRFRGGYAQYRGAYAPSGHREAYIALIGPIPPDLVIDHLCRVRHCVNPDHLEPVTQSVNIRRGELPAVNVSRSNEEMCRKGLHPWTAINIKINATTGKPQCRQCLTVAYRRAGERKRGKPNPVPRACA